MTATGSEPNLQQEEISNAAESNGEDVDGIVRKRAKRRKYDLTKCLIIACVMGLQRLKNENLIPREETESSLSIADTSEQDESPLQSYEEVNGR